MIHVARVAGLALIGVSSVCFAAEAPLGSGSHVLEAAELDAVTAGGASVISAASALADGSIVLTATSARGDVEQFGPGGNRFATRSNGAAIALGVGGTASADADSQHLHPTPPNGFAIKQTLNFIGFSAAIESSYFVSDN